MNKAGRLMKIKGALGCLVFLVCLGCSQPSSRPISKNIPLRVESAFLGGDRLGQVPVEMEHWNLVSTDSYREGGSTSAKWASSTHADLTLCAFRLLYKNAIDQGKIYVWIQKTSDSRGLYLSQSERDAWEGLFGPAVTNPSVLLQLNSASIWRGYNDEEVRWCIDTRRRNDGFIVDDERLVRLTTLLHFFNDVDLELFLNEARPR